jgi:hypothetical protein
MDGTRGGREQKLNVADGGVAVHHEVDVAALLEVRIEDRLAGRAPAPLGYLGESESALTHQIICYTKRLKYHAEEV